METGVGVRGPAPACVLLRHRIAFRWWSLIDLGINTKRVYIGRLPCNDQ